MREVRVCLHVYMCVFCLRCCTTAQSSMLTVSRSTRSDASRHELNAVYKLVSQNCSSWSSRFLFVLHRKVPLSRLFEAAGVVLSFFLLFIHIAVREGCIDADRGPLWLTVFHIHRERERGQERDLPQYWAITLRLKVLLMTFICYPISNAHSTLFWRLILNHCWRINVLLMGVYFPHSDCQLLFSTIRRKEKHTKLQLKRRSFILIGDASPFIRTKRQHLLLRRDDDI